MRWVAWATVLILVASPTASGQGTQDACADAPEPALFAEWETSLENLAFDGNGSLYASDVGGARIVEFAPDGSMARTIDVAAHGLVWGPDDRLYAVVTAGDGVYDIQRSSDASVTAFEVYSQGVTTYNGMTFDAAGNLYVSDDNIAPPAVPPDLIRIPASDPMAWEPWTDIYGPNGLAFDSNTGSIYTVITADQSSPVLRLSASDPGAVDVVAYLSFGFATLEPSTHAAQGNPQYSVPKGLDDLVLGPDGLLYLVGHLSGELLRVDPATGAACVLASGLEEPTSVRIAHGFGPHGGKLFVTTWGGTGITGIALGQAGMHPVGKLWAFDVGFREEPAGTIVAPPPANDTITAVHDNGEPPSEQDPGTKDSPAGPMAVLALAIGLAFTLRRRIR